LTSNFIMLYFTKNMRIIKKCYLLKKYHY
jgi:hypothetical protein